MDLAHHTMQETTESRTFFAKTWCGKAEFWFFVGSCCLAPFTKISPEFHQNSARTSNWSTLKKGDNHNSAFPQDLENDNAKRVPPSPNLSSYVDAQLTAQKLTLTPTEMNFRSLPGPRHSHFGCFSL